MAAIAACAAAQPYRVIDAPKAVCNDVAKAGMSVRERAPEARGYGSRQIAIRQGEALANAVTVTFHAP